MVLAVLSTTETYHEIASLNFRHNYDIHHLSAKTVAAARKALESPGTYTHVFIDVTCFKENADSVLQLLERLLETTSYTFLVLVDGYVAGSRLVADLVDIGIARSNIVLSTGTPLKIFINNVLQENLPAAGAADEVADCIKSDTTQQSLQQTVVALPKTIIAPSQIPYFVAKKEIVQQPAKAEPLGTESDDTLEKENPATGRLQRFVQIMTQLLRIIVKATVVGLIAVGLITLLSGNVRTAFWDNLQQVLQIVLGIFR